MKTGLTEIIILHDNNAPYPSFEEIVNKSNKAFFTILKKAEAEVHDGEIRITYAVSGESGTGYKLIADDIPVAAVRLGAKNFIAASGMRDIFDAMGNTMLEKGKAYSASDESEHPENVIFILTAFGRDNASKSYTFSQIADMVAHQSYVYKWKFFCLTTEPAVPEQLGIPEECCTFINDEEDDFYEDAMDKLTGRIVYTILHSE
jgi:hypothetical protein